MTNNQLTIKTMQKRNKFKQYLKTINTSFKQAHKKTNENNQNFKQTFKTFRGQLTTIKETVEHYTKTI